jgi:hypothetical protein
VVGGGSERVGVGKPCVTPVPVKSAGVAPPPPLCVWERGAWKCGGSAVRAGGDAKTFRSWVYSRGASHMTVQPVINIIIIITQVINIIIVITRVKDRGLFIGHHHRMMMMNAKVRDIFKGVCISTVLGAEPEHLTEMEGYQKRQGTPTLQRAWTHPQPYHSPNV